MPNYQLMQIDNGQSLYQVYGLDILTIKTITLKNVKSPILDVIVILLDLFALCEVLFLENINCDNAMRIDLVESY